MRKEQFKRPEPGFSMYEGRTRGKRMKYTYSDDEDIFYTDSSTRRSTRNTGTATPAETGPVTTMSGRQIRAPPRLNPVTGESTSVQGDSEFETQDETARARRSSVRNSRSRRNTSAESDVELDEGEYGDDENDDEDADDAKDGDAHGSEESEEEDEFDEDEAMVEDDLEDRVSQSLVVKLKVTPPRLRNALGPKDAGVMNALTGQGSPTSELKQSGAASTEVVDEINANSTLVPQPESKTSADDSTIEKKTETRSTPEPSSTIITNGFQTPKEPALPATSLAFRGSPEKPQHAVPVQIVDVGKHD